MTTQFGNSRLQDRQIDELIGIARGLIADGVLNDLEIETLYKWLAASAGVTQNPVVALLFQRMSDILADGIIDPDERAELFEALSALAANDFEVGEAHKTATLPLCVPPPPVAFPGRSFLFTGSFTFGTRRDCEAAVVARGGTCAKSVSRKVDFVVVGEYASDAWVHSSYGRKIETAVRLREDGHPISVISEAHWRAAL